MLRICSVVRGAVAIILLVAASAYAEPVSETLRSPAAISDMQTGRLLIRAGRLKDARTFLEQARPSNGEEQIERLFLLGQIEMRLGMPRRAAERFEAILALRPELTRVRLELARAYYFTGSDDKARYHFSFTLADELPSSVESAVEDFLRRIDTRKRWSVSVSAAMLPETKRPSRETVLIGGVPFRLNENANSSSGTGALVSAGFSFSPRLTDELRGVLAASAATKLYEGPEWNEVTTSADLGLTRLFDKGSASGGVRLGQRWTGNKRHNRSVGPWTQMRWRFSNSTFFDVALSAGYRRHDTRHERDGWRVAASPRLVYALDGRTSIEAEPVFEAVGAKTDHHGSRLVGVRVTVSRAFKGGLSVSFSPGAHIRRHAAKDPLFGKKRVDKRARLGVRLLHRSLQYRGFAPYIGYSVEQNRSNIPIHEYRSHGVFAGISRTF